MAAKVEVRLWWHAATSAYLHDYRKVKPCLQLVGADEEAAGREG